MGFSEMITLCRYGSWKHCNTLGEFFCKPGNKLLCFSQNLLKKIYDNESAGGTRTLLLFYPNNKDN